MPTEDLGPEARYLIQAQHFYGALEQGGLPSADTLMNLRRRERAHVRVIEDMRGLGDALLDGADTRPWLTRLVRDVAEWRNS